eukprot:CAMPEP_0175767864 /NCGR_PEP_ID=MMETSP0097-20121207/70133_1 /TAXON_ID=311494 /ORGANISM="Alexandrium monilatum, Strain CCMP3105" /LENGTH=53 /DNA_ID=CAMNT_0017077959 /DNA_START=195 /DNA_END=357 /DNA_ORIENTATION=+
MSRALAPPASLAADALPLSALSSAASELPVRRPRPLARISRDTGAGVGDETLK